MAIRTVSVQLQAQISGYVAGMRQAGLATQQFSQEVERLGQKSPQKLRDVTMAGTVAGAAMLAVAGYAVKAAYTFDKQMSEVQAVSGATVGQLGALRDAAIQAGKDTVFSASDAAKAEAELAKAGVSTGEILGGALKGSLALASAGQMDLAASATIAAQAMNIFGLHGSAVSHIADVLASASNASAADMQGLGDALRQGGQQAAQTGLSLEDTVGTLSALADNALVGADAGTSLKTMLQSLTPTSAKTKEMMDELGISFYDAQGKFIGIAGVAQVLHNKLSGLTQAQRNQALAQIFGSDATRAATVLYKEGAAGIQGYIDKVNVSGAAAKTAAAKMNNLAGDVEQLKGSFETLAIQSGGGVSGGLRMLTQAANGLLGQLIALPKPITETATVVSGLGGVGLLAATGFVKAKDASDRFKQALSDMGPTGAKAAAGLSRIGGVLGKAGLWGTAALIAYEGVSTLFRYLDKSHKPIVRDVNAMSDALAHFADTGKAIGEFAKVTGGNLDAFAKRVVSSQAALKQMSSSAAGQQAYFAGTIDPNVVDTNFTEALQHVADAASKAKGDVAELDTGLANLVQNGGATRAYVDFEQLTTALRNTGLTTQEINAMFPQYSAAVAGVSTSSQTAASSLGGLKDMVGNVSISLDKAVGAGVALKDALDALSGANEGFGKANVEAEDALAKLRKGIKFATDGLSAHTAVGRANLDLIFATIDADKNQFQALYNKEVATKGQTQALTDATAQYDKYIAKLRKSLIAEGYSSDQVDELLRQYAAIPPVVTTSIDTPGLNAALKKMNHVETWINKNDGRKVKIAVDVRANGDSVYTVIGTGRKLERWGGAYRHAADGLLRDAAVYSPASPARYAFAEPATGGEAFVPRFGDYMRSMSILQQAAAWYGATVSPRAGGSSGPGGVTVQNLNIRAYSDRFSIAQVQRDLALYGVH